MQNRLTSTRSRFVATIPLAHARSYESTAGARSYHGPGFLASEFALGFAQAFAGLPAHAGLHSVAARVAGDKRGNPEGSAHVAGVNQVLLVEDVFRVSGNLPLAFGG